MSGRKSQTHPLRHRYERLLLSCWLIAMLSLAFAWWKSIDGSGIIGIASPQLTAEVEIVWSGARFAASVVANPGWDAWAFYFPNALPRSEWFGKFYWGPDDSLPGAHGLALILPFWFLMLAVSLLFLALHWFMKRRIRLIMENLPAES